MKVRCLCTHIGKGGRAGVSQEYEAVVHDPSGMGTVGVIWCADMHGMRGGRGRSARTPLQSSTLPELHAPASDAR